MRSTKRNQLTILSLHRISNENDYFFDPIRPDVFEELIKYALKNYQIISFEELAENKESYKKPPLIFSFDDGYYDFYEYALPILVKYKLPSNHNIVNECVNSNSVIWTQRLNNIFNHCKNNNLELNFKTDEFDENITKSKNNWIQFYSKIFFHLSKLKKQQRLKVIKHKEDQLSISAECKMMSWEQIKECTKHDVEIGSHAYSHDSIPSITDEDGLTFEILNSKKEIEKHIERPVSIIALPNGQGNVRVNEVVQRSGYRYLLYVNDTINNLKTISGKHPIILDRVNLINESIYEMILRTELLHSKLGGLRGKLQN